MAAYRTPDNDDLVLIGMDVEPVTDDTPIDLGVTAADVKWWLDTNAE